MHKSQSIALVRNVEGVHVAQSREYVVGGERFAKAVFEYAAEEQRHEAYSEMAFDGVLDTVVVCVAWW